jgi:CTP-dependent riboflavin kinase
MGGGGSRTVYREQIIEIRADPKLLEQLKQFEQ